MTGRSRAGKTFLIDTLLENDYYFRTTGIQNGNMKTQLVNFAVKLFEYNGTNEPKVEENWQNAYSREIVDAEICLEQFLGD